MNKRSYKILELLNDEEKLSVNDISENLGVSLVTIRKDLTELEERGLIKRAHGFAQRVSPVEITSRMSIDYETKLLIAKRAVELVAPGETIMIESGSTCAMFALELVTQKDVTIVTNSSFIARYIRHVPGAKVVLLGGNYQNDSEVTVGPITEMNAREYYVDKLFVGADGYVDDIGFTTMDHMRASAVRAMGENARQAYILTTSIKFGDRGVARLFNTKQVHCVVTDSNLDPYYKKSLTNQGIELILV